MIMPLSTQSQDKGFVAADSKSLVQSIESLQGARWALLVGIADYPSVQGFEIEQLRAPVKDVNALAAFLKDPDKGGFDDEHVFILTDEEATYRNILMTFNDISRRAAPEDMVVFYFSGHGAPPSDDDTTYLIPYDHDLRDIETTCINFDDLASKIQKMRASKVVVILDACHSGGVKQKGAKAAVNKGIVKRYLNAFQESEGRALLLSSDESEVSWEDAESGIFTRFLLEGLNGAADENDDGIVTFTEAALYVEKNVPEYTRNEFRREQRPTRRYGFGQVRGEIPLAINKRKINQQRHKELMDERTKAIYQAMSAGLDTDLKEFSLQVVQSVYEKALKDEPATKQESLLLQEIDALKNGTLKAADYALRARVIYNLGRTRLQITVTPADAMVTLAPVGEAGERGDAGTRIIAPTSPNIYEVAQGRYQLSAKSQGYAPYSRELILDQENESVTVQLQKLMGTLQLQVDPVDATVMVTPLDITDVGSPTARKNREVTSGEQLPTGKYRVTAEKEGYEPAVKEPVQINANASAWVRLTLMPKLATIGAPDLPVGTRVFVDGESVRLPYDLRAGTHSIRLERDGFQTIEMYESLQPGQTLRLENLGWISTKPSLTQLRVVVTPTDATVTLAPANAQFRIAAIQNSVIRPSGLNVYKVEHGRYYLSVKRSGYAPHSRDLILDQESESVTVELEQLMGTLELQVYPADAMVAVTPLAIAAPEIGGSKTIYVQPTDGRIQDSPLRIGTYRITAEKDGYEPLRQDVEIKTNASTPVTLALKPKPASVVALSLPDGTRVLVDDKYVTLPHRLQPGTYGIRLERDEFETIRMNEVLQPGQTLRLENLVWIPVEPSLTQFRISVTPTDATITLAAASTPRHSIPLSSRKTYQLEQGRYRLTVQREGYTPHSREFTLDQDSELVTVELERLMGTLKLQVDSDAKVMLTPLSIAAPDDKFKPLETFVGSPTARTTDGRIQDLPLPIGTYRVAAEKEGYEFAVEESIEVKANDYAWVTLVLKPKPATIMALDLPNGARILVDGESIALPHKLQPGTHRIRLESDGFRPIEMYEVLEPAQILSLSPKWIPITPPKPGTLWGTVLKSTVMPGWGDFPHRKVPGIVMMTLQLGTLAGAAFYHLNHTENVGEYDDALKEAYPENFDTWGEYKAHLELTESKRKDMGNSEKLRNVLLFSAVIGVRVVGALESAIFAPKGRSIASSIEDGTVTLAWRQSF